MSENSRQSYGRDLKQLAFWLKQNNITVLELSRDSLRDFLAWRTEQGYNARSMARMLSATRGFYNWLHQNGRMAENPTLLVESPRYGRSLPKTLTEGDVEQLLGAPDPGQAIGLRDRAMLELLYACGMRVSELVSMELSRVNFRQGVLRICGKGSKERLVPMGEAACEWLEKYLLDARDYFIPGGQSDVLFPGRTGGVYDSADLLAPGQEICCYGRNRQTIVPPCSQTCLCHPPA